MTYTHCPGYIISYAADALHREGKLDFIDGEWVDDPLLIASMRAAAKARDKTG